MSVRCEICPKECLLNENQTGFCGARACRNGKIIPLSYGYVTSLALDPIEKKPLNDFYPGSKILSVGSFGCNMRCAFCQNYSISMPDQRPDTEFLPPEKLVEIAAELKPKGNIGIAYTYNEPLTNYEYVLDSSKLVKEAGMKNVLVTNGQINEDPLLKLLPYIDAANIDLKGFTSEYYKELGGDFNTVKNTIKKAADNCHVEVTTLVVPGKNDSKEEIERAAKWLSEIDADIPLHITRFFPRYKMADTNATKVSSVYELKNAAQRYLNNVYAGNC